MKSICALALITALTLTACFPRIALYSPAAYREAVELKVEARLLVLKGTEPYRDHAEEAGKLMVRVEKAYEYAKGIPDNELTVKQWEILKDSGGNLLGGYLEKWKAEGTLGENYVVEKSRQMDLAFDQIIGLESGKVKRTGGE